MTDIRQGLLIAAIGMGLVFAVIIFLWGLMALMMKVTSRKKDTPKNSVILEEDEAVLVPEMQAAETKRRAAAAAVAVQMALSGREKPRAGSHAQDQEGGLSPWDAFNRTHQLQQKNTRG